MDNKTKRKIEKLLDLQEKGEVAIVEHLLELEENVEKKYEETKELVNKIAETNKLSNVDMVKIKGDKGDKGEAGKAFYGSKGDKGDKGDKGEKGDRGIDGKNGKDGKIIKGIDGKDGYTPKQGVDYFDGRDGRDAVLPNLRELSVSTVNYIETLEGDDRIDIKAIKGADTLSEQIYQKYKNIPGLGGSTARNFYQLYDVPQTGYTGQAGKIIKVKTDETGLEFGVGSGGGTVDTIVAGVGISVDSTDPANPIVSASASAPEWGDITGTLSDQTDLQTALNGKADSLTADQNYVTDAQLTVISNTSGTNSGNVTVTGEDFISLTGQQITANAIDLDNLSATGTPSSSTFLRGDNTWATPVGSGDVSKVGTPVNNQVGVWTGDGTIEGDTALTFDTTTDTLATTNITATTVTASLVGNASTVTTNANLTGVVTSVGNATAIADAALSIAKTSGLQTALDAKQPLDADLTTIAGLTATTDNFIQSKGSAWSSRTVAQVKTDLGLTGTNSGDQTSIVGITGTKAQFDTAVTDGNFLYVGDVTQYTDEMAQDAVGGMVDTTLVYVDGTPSLARAAISGDVVIASGSNTAAIGTGVIVNADINASAAIDATKIADGSVTSTEFQYINTLSSNAQTQIDGKLSTSGGTISGTLDVVGDRAGGVMTVERVPVTPVDGIYGTQTIKATKTTNMADGFGVAQTFAIEDNAGVENVIGSVQLVRDGADNTGKMNLVTQNAGSPVINQVLYSDGSVEFSDSLYILEGAGSMGDFSGSGQLFVKSADSSLYFRSDAGTESNLTARAPIASPTFTGTVSVPATNFTVGASLPFSDSAGTLTLQNVDVIDATTEATIESAIDTLANLTSIQGRTVTLADAGADAILGWDDSQSAYENLTQGEVLAVIGTASPTAQGVVELAIDSEVNTGTSTSLAVSPDSLAGSYAGTKSVCIQVFGPEAGVYVGDGRAYFVVPPSMNGMNLISANGFTITAGTTNATTAMVHNKTDAQDMLSGAISIASGATVGTSGTVNTSFDDVATNDVIRIDVDSVSTTLPEGLYVVLEFRLP